MLDSKVAELAKKYLPLAKEILAEAIRVPADYVEKPIESGGDPFCGLSNHEHPRLEGFIKAMIANGCVERPEDVGYDEFGNLVWTVEDREDGIPRDQKIVIYLDGHTDTVAALRSQWIEKIGGGIDAYNGMVDPTKVNEAFLRSQLGWLAQKDQWEHMLFGRGSADQLGGVVAQIVASKILLELKTEGALKGVIIRSYGTVAEEDNDGGGPMYLTRKVLPGAGAELVPDVFILTEGTGCTHLGSIGIYRGQRGRMQIEVEVVGRSCHGSMPWEGKNPLEFGAAIIVEAAKRYNERDGFLDNEFLGHGTRTASWAELKTPSDCAVPDVFTFRFDRRLTVGETAEQALADVENLDAVKIAREAGLVVNVRVPVYSNPTWKGYIPGNKQIYPGWETPADHPAIKAAVETYKGAISPYVPEPGTSNISAEPRVARWIFSTDGVGVPLPVDDTTVTIPESKKWVVSGAVKHPAMFGIGPGIEQNTHKIGEVVDIRELEHCIAFLARFPSVYRDLR